MNDFYGRTFYADLLRFSRTDLKPSWASGHHCNEAILPECSVVDRTVASSKRCPSIFAFRLAFQPRISASLVGLAPKSAQSIIGIVQVWVLKFNQWLIEEDTWKGSAFEICWLFLGLVVLGVWSYAHIIDSAKASVKIISVVGTSSLIDELLRGVAGVHDDSVVASFCGAFGASCLSTEGDVVAHTINLLRHLNNRFNLFELLIELLSLISQVSK